MKAKRSPISLLLLVTAAVALSSASPILAEAPPTEHRLLADDFNIAVGGFLVDFSTRAQAGRDVVGGLVDLEDDFSLDPDSSTVRLDGYYRFNPKHSIDFGYFSVSRTGLATLDTDIVYNDVLYDVGAEVRSEFDVDFIRATYRYSFVNDGRTEAGIIAGLSTYSFSAAIDGEATIDDGSGGVTVERVRVDSNIVAPIPVVGMFIAHALSPRWVLRLSATFLDLETGDYAGRVVDTRATIDYYFSRHVGLGFGQNTTDIKFSKETDDGFGVDYKQDGLLAYLSIVY